MTKVFYWYYICMCQNHGLFEFEFYWCDLKRSIGLDSIDTVWHVMTFELSKITLALTFFKETFKTFLLPSYIHSIQFTLIIKSIMLSMYQEQKTKNHLHHLVLNYVG